MLNELKTLVCCIGKNENRYIREYVEWYKELGVTHIRLYDNNDIDGERFEDVIGDYIEEGFVDIVDYRGRKKCQTLSYEECYKELGDQYDWILFIDCDEFLTLPKDNNIVEWLSDSIYDNYDLIHINWRIYGDSDLLEYSEEPLNKRFTKPIPIDKPVTYSNIAENAHIKSVVRGGLPILKWPGASHTPNASNYKCCDDVGSTVDGCFPFANISFRRAYLKHFSTKTVAEYCDKMKRGFPDQLWDGSLAKDLIETRFFRTNEITKEKIEIFKDRLGVDMSYLLPSIYEGEKSKDVKIYSLCYSKKNFQFINDSVVTPLQVGAANGTDVCEVKDNTGINISERNYFYIENTGTYWIWKNVKDCKYKGQMQYRRPLEGINESTDFDKIFSEYDVITCKPFNHPENSQPTKEQPMFIPAQTVEEGYAFSNCIDDLYIIEMIINIFYPEYKESYIKYIKNGPNLYYSNGFILRTEDYDRYCDFLFDCLDKYQSMVDVSTPEKLKERVKYNMEVGKYPKHMVKQSRTEEAIKWQMSIGGFLSERLWTLWVLHNFDRSRIMEIPYKKMEEGMYT